MKILVTGGAGFIGSHTLVELNAAGHDTVVVDNLSNSNRKSLERVAELTGKEIPFYEVDIRDREGLNRVMEAHHFDACIHFAGLKAVGESVEKPWEYYENNIGGTLTLLDVMRQHSCKNIIFSSSATVYGDPAIIPITEECPKGHCTNPYGQTKSMLEEIMMDMQKADKEWNIVLLRYFNPIGAHPSAEIGELPNGVPANLVPYLTQTAIGVRKELSIFGDDYDTPDGSCIRDFINVVDLAKAHVKALERMLEGKSEESLEVFNIGTGEGASVLQLLAAFEKATGVKVPHKIVGRREGDIVKIWADPKKANEVLGWKAEETLEDTMLSAWRWQQRLRERGIM